jgi:signal transduction histidine kinase/PAS domain-containing protein/ActR/RegA family two-component response regulator
MPRRRPRRIGGLPARIAAGMLSLLDAHGLPLYWSGAEDNVQVPDSARVFRPSDGARAGSRGGRYPRRAGALVAVSCLALLWAWDDYVRFCAEWFPGLTPMPRSTALALSLAGVGLWLSASDPSPRFAQWVTRFIGIVVAAFAIVSLFEHLSGIDVTRWVLATTLQGELVSPNTAIALALAGMALLLLDVPSRAGPWPSHVFSLGVLLVCLEVFIEDLYGLPQMVGAGADSRMPLSAAAMLAAVGTGTLVARPHGPLLEPVTSESGAASLARRLLLVAVIVPLAAGFIQEVGLRADLYGSALGSAALVVGIILVLVGFIWFHARQLARVEARAEEAGAEQARLAESERAASLRAQLADRRLRAIVQAIDAVVWEADAETLRVSFVSDQAVKLLGYGIDRWHAAPGSWLDLLHDEDRERVACALRAAGRDGRDQEVEYRAVDAAGRTVWLRHRFAAVKGPTGRAELLRGLITDITAGKLRGRRAVCRHAVNQALADSATVREAVPSIMRAACECLDWHVGGVWEIDRESATLRNVDLWHVPTISIPKFRDACRELRLACGAGLPGRVWAGGEPVWIPDVTADDNFPRAAVAAQAGLHAAFGFPVKSGDEIVAVMEFFSPEIRAPDADVLEVMESIGAQMSQLIERERTQQAVRRAYEAERAARGEAEAANRAKDEFLAMLGHELRNPIGAISNSIRVLTQGKPQPEQTDALHAIVVRQSRTLTRLVDDLLDVARLTSGKIVLKREAVDLAQVAERCLASLRAAQRMNLHEVVLDAAPVWVDGDPTRLEQVFANLLENALKYTAAGGRISVRVGAEDGCAMLSVRDTGRGIEPEMIPKIFDAFAQAPQSLDRAQGGLGIGLTLVKRLVELHGGEVEVESEGTGRGSEFTIWLPVRAAPERVDGVPKAAPAPARRRILVVEDYADAREALCALLEQAGHSVEIAVTGDEGVEKAVALFPDVALIDVGLPGLDGYEVARRIRRARGGEHMLLIALTGYGQEHDRRRAQEAGFDAHLVKPLDPRELWRVLSSAEVSAETAADARVA